MTEFKQERYKNIIIKYFISNEGMFSANALDILSTNNLEKDRDINHNYPTLERTEVDIKSKIDKFLSNTPKTFKELADTLHGHLTWTGYEDCYLDEFVCKTIVENFIKVYKPS